MLTLTNRVIRYLRFLGHLIFFAWIIPCGFRNIYISRESNKTLHVSTIAPKSIILHNPTILIVIIALMPDNFFTYYHLSLLTSTLSSSTQILLFNIHKTQQIRFHVSSIHTFLCMVINTMVFCRCIIDFLLSWHKCPCCIQFNIINIYQPHFLYPCHV